MFEFDQYEPERWTGSEPCVSVGADDGDTTIERPESLAFLWWSEHCIECAEPDCYTTCALYQRRPDGRCRRFVYGIRPVGGAAFPLLSGADVTFKTWGKLETHGNTWLEPTETVVRRTTLLAKGAEAWLSAPAADDDLTIDPAGIALPPVPRRIVKRLQVHAASCGDARSILPTHFLIDVINPEQRSVSLQVSMRVSEDMTESGVQVPPPFLESLNLPPGRSCHRIAADRFAHVAESGRPFKIAVMPAGDESVRLIFRWLDLVGAAVAGATTATVHKTQARPIKCVVFDLDGTLWPGVLLEDGDTRPRPAMVRLIRLLDERGILVSVASKNPSGPAMERLRAAGLHSFVLAPQVGWEPKSLSLRTIAETLNIGVDSLAFVDDSPFERAEVASALPEVRCCAPEDASAMLDDPASAGSKGADSRRRRQSYRAEEQRRQAAAQWSEDHLGFLRSCELLLTIDDYTTADFERVVELVQRTNQLNFSGAKYTPDEIAKALASRGLQTFVLRCRDRFGDYGTVGVAMVRRAGAVVRIEDMMMSCRVQGRLVEQAVLAHLAHGCSEPPSQLWINFRQTPRNTPAARVLDALGFRPAEEGRVLDLAGRDLATEAVRVVATPAPETR